MNTHVSMVGSARVAQEDADVGGCPLGILALAVKTNLSSVRWRKYLVIGDLKQPIQGRVSFLVRHVQIRHFNNYDDGLLISN